MVRRAGFSLMEIVLAVALFGGCAVALLTSLTHGAAGAARSSETQMASIVAARVMDRMLSAGYAGLVALPAADGVFGLPDPDSDAGVERLTADGVEYQARYMLSMVRDGLMRVVLVLTWERAGTIGAAEPGQLVVLRYVADPTRSLDAR